MSPTYELTQESKLVELPGNGRTIQVFRIRALKDLPGAGVRAGDLGGFVESYQNLQHDDSGDSAWIYIYITMRPQLLVLSLKVMPSFEMTQSYSPQPSCKMQTSGTHLTMLPWS